MVYCNVLRDPKTPKPCTDVNLEDSKVKSVASNTTVHEEPAFRGMGVLKSMLKVAYSWTVLLVAVILTDAGSI
jgi:hypothetical protein